ncbi:MAG: ABC transporter ATP-binding protein/permease [Erysipelotrichaceae bacterium]|nr:ABC transporter ATP-binding protein/permease [Erysipelotrichaceae bacterium]MDY5252944.1 ABC transporter ATP-binding protein [Erysipelotrichaceae bacterium]
MKRKGRVVMARLIVLVKPLLANMLIAITLGLAGHLCATFITIIAAYGLLHKIALAKLILILLSLAILRAIFRYIEQASNHYIAFKLLALIRDKVFMALRRLAPAKLAGKDAGNLINIITSDIELLEVFYAHTISPIAIAILFAIIMVSFIGRYDMGLAMIALGSYVLVGVVIPLLADLFSKDQALVFRYASGNLSEFVLESLRGIKEIIQYDAKDKRMHALEEQTAYLNRQEDKLKKVQAYNMSLTNAVVLLADIVMLFYGSYLLMTGKINFEGLLISVVALFASFGPFIALANLGSGLQNTLAAGNRILDILDEQPLLADIEGMPDAPFGSVKIADVEFGYGQEKILDDINISLRPKMVLGIEGKSGSGKSTLLKLLMRFWEVDKGQIMIGDRNIQQINTSKLRDMESYVSQSAHLFHDTLKNNLKIAKLDASDDEMIAACKKANIHEFIMSLPKGYDTMVSELGSSLSAGEKQRINLARAFLHNGDLMLLDEPTSNLDSLNEAMILNALSKVKDKTIILVSHRHSTLRRCQQIIKIDSGRKS